MRLSALQSSVGPEPLADPRRRARQCSAWRVARSLAQSRVTRHSRVGWVHEAAWPVFRSPKVSRDVRNPNGRQRRRRVIRRRCALSPKRLPWDPVPDGGRGSGLRQRSQSDCLHMSALLAAGGEATAQFWLRPTRVPRPHACANKLRLLRPGPMRMRTCRRSREAARGARCFGGIREGPGGTSLR